jgi:putative RecB family exonuclease
MIEYLSYSSINLFLTCGEAWKRKYLLKEPQSSSPALVFGSALHNTIEGYIANRAEGATHKELTDLWPDQWSAAVERDNLSCEWGADTPEQHFNEGVRLLSNPELQQMVNRLTPMRDEQGLFMERKIELRVPGVPIPIIGYIDIVTNDGVPGDFKTSAQQWSNEKAKAELQPIFYLAAMNQLGRPSPGMRFRHYVVTKTKVPKVQVIETAHTIDSVFWLFGLIQQVWKAIENESFVVNPHAWLCGPKYCGAWSKCRGKGL